MSKDEEVEAKRLRGRETMRRWIRENPDRHRKNVAAWREANPDKEKKIRDRSNARYRRNMTPEQRAAAAVRTREWQLANPERYKAMLDAERRRLKEEVIAAYGGKCVCCPEGTVAFFEFLTIDHIGKNGASHRRAMNGRNMYRWLRANNYPKDDYRLLCMNCNFADGKYGKCPHQG